MSVRDLIWINVAQGLRVKNKAESEAEEFKAKWQMMDVMYTAICDCRQILLDSNMYIRAAALKGSSSRIELFDINSLPSMSKERAKREAEEAERRAKMTPEEIVEQNRRDLLAGKVVRA